MSTFDADLRVTRAALELRRAQIETALLAIDQLLDTPAAPAPAEVAPPLAIEPPKRGRKKKAAKAKPGRKRKSDDAGDVDDRFKSMWDDGITVDAIAKAFSRTTAWVYLKAKNLGLKKRPKPGGRIKARKPRPEHQPRINGAAKPNGAAVADLRPSAGALKPAQLIAFLKEIGSVVQPAQVADHWIVEKKMVDAIGLLEHANVWRRKNNQPPFTLAAA